MGQTYEGLILAALALANGVSYALAVITMLEITITPCLKKFSNLHSQI